MGKTMQKGHHNDGDICEGRHGGADTSIAAHRSKSDDERVAMRARLLEYIRSRGAEGATADEVERRLGLPHQSASARISEMFRDGAIHDSGRRRKTAHGRAARVYLPGAPSATVPGEAPVPKAEVLTGRGDLRPPPAPPTQPAQRELI